MTCGARFTIRPWLMLSLTVAAVNVVLLSQHIDELKGRVLQAAAKKGESTFGLSADTSPVPVHCMRRITERCVCVDHGPRDACIKHVASRCGWYAPVHLQPTHELLRPGELSSRSLSEQSLCFLWYSGSFSSRATGKLLLSRQGGPVDDKALLARHVRLYEDRFQCPAHQVLPQTIDLRDKTECKRFFSMTNNATASTDGPVWFLKEVKGSTGRHIRLLRNADIQRLQSITNENLKRAHLEDSPTNNARHDNGSASEIVFHTVCNNTIASLGVANMLSIGNRKFDQRAFVLVASVRPLVVYIHHGHLRFSALNLSTSSSATFSSGAAGSVVGALRNSTGNRLLDRDTLDDDDLARHVTNPRFGLKRNKNASSIIRPVSVLKDYLSSLPSGPHKKTEQQQ